jgi:hypothetical protein
MCVGALILGLRGESQIPHSPYVLLRRLILFRIFFHPSLELTMDFF